MIKWTRGDIFGGITAGIVALPLALGFGIYSGLGAAAGMYGAIFLGFFAALFGGTPSQISGPTGPMTVVTAATVAAFSAMAGANAAGIAGAIIASFILAGLLQVLMGVLKIGSLIKYIPYPVISGFMSGIGLIIILLQIFKALGLDSPASTLDVIREIGPSLKNTNIWALFYAVLTIAIIYIFPRVTKAVPSTLVALLLVTVLSVLLKKEVPLIGEIPSGFPPMQLDALWNIDPVFFPIIVKAAITLAALGAIDSLLTSVIADNVTKTKHNSNRELVGQGIGNAVAGFFGGLPGAGATMRTLVNIRSGGRNRVSGVLHSLILLAILLGAGRYAALIPLSVLAGILITVGIGILDYRSLGHIRKVPRTDAAIMLMVLLVTVFFDLLIAVAVGMVMASLLFMKKMSEVAEEKYSSVKIDAMADEINWPDEKMPLYMQDNILVKHMEGPLFFGFAGFFQTRLSKMPFVRFVVLRMEKVPFMDQTGLYAFEEAMLSLKQKGMQVLLIGVQTQPLDMMKRIRIVPELVPKDHIFSSFKDCIDWLSVLHKHELL